MKKVLLLVAALMILSSAVSANPGGWLDLFADADHGTWCLYPPPAQYVPITVYFIARPPADGMRATECKMVIPDPCVSITNEIYHPNMNLGFGDWPTGMSLSFDMCMAETFVMVAEIQILSLSCAWGTGCQIISLAARDDSGFFGFATCATGFPPETAEHQVDIYLNCDPCPDFIATENKSWGAIKTLYGE